MISIAGIQKLDKSRTWHHLSRHNYGGFGQDKGYLPDPMNLQHAGTKGRSTMGVETVVLISVVYINVQVAEYSIIKRSIQVGLNLYEPTTICLSSFAPYAKTI